MQNSYSLRYSVCLLTDVAVFANSPLSPVGQCVQHYAHYYTVLAALHRMLLSARPVHYEPSAVESRARVDVIFPEAFRLPQDSLRSRCIDRALVVAALFLTAPALI